MPAPGSGDGIVSAQTNAQEGARTSIMQPLSKARSITATGHERPICDGRAMSALPPKATAKATCRAVALGGHADPFYSITLSARARKVSGIVTPSALAALRLMYRSNFVGCSTGSSLGFAPFNILSTYPEARRKSSASLGP